MIEHISLEGGRKALSECHRVLKVGGVIRIATPNLARLLELYKEPLSSTAASYLKWALEFNSLAPELGPCGVVNKFVRSWGHTFIYDSATLALVLQGSGFEVLRESRPNESFDPQLVSLEQHGTEIGDAANEFETMIVEAVRR